jgi:hypothetical protein
MGTLEDFASLCSLSTNLLILLPASGRTRTDDRRFAKPTADDLAIQLVDTIIALGDAARQLKLALHKNDHVEDQLSAFGWGKDS